MNGLGKWILVVAATFVLAACGGGSGDGENHSLKGTWNGYMYVAPNQTIKMTIDGEGDITELLINGDTPSDFIGGYVEGGPGIYTMTWISDPLGAISFPFLTDEEQIQDPHVEHMHGSIIYMYGAFVFIGTVERDGSTSTTFFPSDILGSWSGYGYAYSQGGLGFAPFTPVTVEGVDDMPLDTFTVSLPGATIDGVITASAGAYYLGSAVTGAQVRMVMSLDKQYVTVEAIPPGDIDLEDLSFYSLNRD